MKSYFNNASHENNFYSVYEREYSEAVSSCIELSEIQANRFISSIALEEGLRLEFKDGRPVQKHKDGKNSQGG